MRDDQAVSASDSPPIFDEFAEDFEGHAVESAYNAWYDRPADRDELLAVLPSAPLTRGAPPYLEGRPAGSLSQVRK